MAQDLGNINITIRGGTAGGTTGSGSPGGGPAPLPSSAAGGATGASTASVTVPATPPPPTGGSASTQAIAQSAAQNMPSLFERLLGRAAQSSAIKGEVMGFLQSPSLGGLAQLGQVSSSTGAALARLGAAAGPIGVAALATAGAFILSLKMMSSAAQMTAQRIQETMRFSGVMQYQAGVEKFREFGRTMADLNRNGAMYAQSQRLQTIVNDRQARAMTELNGIVAEAGQVFQKLQIGFYAAIEGIAKVINGVKSILNFLGVGMEEMLLFAVAPIAGPAFAWLKEPIMQIVSYLFGIEANTKPQVGASGVNNWFLGDLAAMTRNANAYSDKPSGKSAAVSPRSGRPNKPAASAPPTRGLAAPHSPRPPRVGLAAPQ